MFATLSGLVLNPLCAGGENIACVDSGQAGEKRWVFVSGNVLVFIDLEAFGRKCIFF